MLVPRAQHLPGEHMAELRGGTLPPPAWDRWMQVLGSYIPLLFLRMFFCNSQRMQATLRKHEQPSCCVYMLMPARPLLSATAAEILGVRHPVGADRFRRCNSRAKAFAREPPQVQPRPHGNQGPRGSRKLQGARPEATEAASCWRPTALVPPLEWRELGLRARLAGLNSFTQLGQHRIEAVSCERSGATQPCITPRTPGSLWISTLRMNMDYDCRCWLIDFHARLDSRNYIF